MLVKEFADHSGVTPDAVRYYTRIGILNPGKGENGYHHFSGRDHRVLQFCLRAKRLGFSLAEVRELIDLSARGRCPCPVARKMLVANIATVRRELIERQQLLGRMEAAASAWHELPDREPTGHELCHLIESTASGCH